MKRTLNIIISALVCVVIIAAIAAGGFFLLYAPTLNVDMSAETGEVTNGASGYLYGIAESGVPSKNMTESVDISTASVKVPGGLQHPIGDISHIYAQLDGTDYNVIYLQDIYSTWYYEQDNIEKLRSENNYDWEKLVNDDYLPKVKAAAQEIKNSPYAKNAVYCIYNECDNGVWFGETKKSSDHTYGVYGSYTKAGAQNFFKAWKTTYDAVKSVDENALIGGPGFCDYDNSEMEAFFEYCAANDCVPDVMIYHELGANSIYGWQQHVDTFKELEKKLGIDEMPIIVSEYGEMQDNGKPGKMLQFITQIEMSKVYADNAYWRLANNLCDVAADDNSPNSNWWLYREYTQLQGKTLACEYHDLFKSNFGKAISGKAKLASKGFMGIACIDGDNKVQIICGGRDGSAVVKLKNIDKTALKGKTVKIKISEVLYKGISGVVTSEVTLKEYTQSVSGSTVKIDMNGLDEANAYFITVEAADGNSADYENGSYIHRYELEEGELHGGAYTYDSAYATTGEADGMVGGIEKDGDGVSIDIEVPTDGEYNLDFIYGNSNDGEYDENGRQNPDDRTYSAAALEVENDGKSESYELNLPNTIKSEYTDCFTLALELTAGEHKITLTHKSGTVTFDSLLVTSAGTESDISVLTDAGRTTDEVSSYLAVVREDGCYTVTADGIKANASVKAALNDNGFDYQNGCTLYLMRGLNYIDFTSKDITRLNIEKAKGTDEQCVNAADFKLTGGATLVDNAAAGCKYIDGISSLGGRAQYTFKAKSSGVYALTFTYANNDEGGKHDYNVDLIERYVTLAVNGQSRDVYCRNTYSWDTYKTVTVYVKLKKGDNKITLTNSGNYKFDGADTYAPNIAKIAINPMAKVEES